MKMDDNLNKLFNLDPIVKGEEMLPVVIPTSSSSAEQKDDDFELARNTLRDLIGKNNAVITDLVDLARNSEAPRAFEVVSQMIKTQSEIAKDLIGIHKQKKDIEGDSGRQIVQTQNNVVFAGSTADLMKMISQGREKGNVIDG
jgi:hypothetical protein